MARFALRLVELPTRDRRELEALVRAQRVLPPRALLDACGVEGDVDALVLEADRPQELERMQERLQAAGVVTVLVDRDARADGDGFLKGVLRRRSITQNVEPVDAAADLPPEDRRFERLRQEGALRRTHWWEWWLERGAMRLKLFVGMLGCVMLVFTAIALTGLLAPVNEIDPFGQGEETDEHGDPVQGVGSTPPSSRAETDSDQANAAPATTTPPAATSATTPFESETAIEDSDHAESSRRPIARWLGWALAGAMVGFIAVFMQRQGERVSTETARKLRLGLWAITGGVLVFLVLSVVRARPSTPVESSTVPRPDDSTPGNASGASHDDDGSGNRTNNLPAWARMLPPPGSFSSMHQQLGALPRVEPEQGTRDLASALPPACDAVPGSFEELACLLRRVPSTPPTDGAAEGSASDADEVTPVENSLQGVAAPVVVPQPAAAEGSATDGASDGSGVGAASNAAAGPGLAAATPEEASSAGTNTPAPASAGSLGSNGAARADTRASAADAQTPEVGPDANAVSEPDETASSPGATAGGPEAANETQGAGDPNVEPTGNVGSILFFVVGWLTGAICAWLGTRKRDT